MEKTFTGKRWKLMKICAAQVMIAMACCGVAIAHDNNAQVLDKKISVSVKNVTMEDALKEVQRVSSIEIFYSIDQLPKGQSITLDAREKKLRNVLDELLTPFSMKYRLDKSSGSIIILKQVPPRVGADSKSGEQDDTQQTNRATTITGTVVDAVTQQPMAGVSIVVKGTTNGTTTDASGRYTLEIPDQALSEVEVVFSFIGYTSFTTKVNGRTIIDVILQEDVKSLDEVVVNAGYYKVSDKERTGNIVKIEAKDIEKQPVQNALSALQGRVSGLDIIQQTGIPGGNFQVRIRGTNSIANGNDPLYIIDGVPFMSSSTAFYQTSGGIYGQGVSPLNSINPSDIQSIEVLKDADATAIYGSRGANGVILITTKQGVAGKTKVDVNFYSGTARVSRQLDLLNTRQYLDIRKEAFANDGITPTTSNAPDLLVWDTTRNTNWQEELIGGTAYINDAQFSISGGDKNTQFSVGAGYHKETTVFPGDNSDQRLSTRVSLTNTSPNNKLKTTVSINYSVNTTDLLSQDLTSRALALSPNAPALYDENDELSWVNWNANFENPLAYLDRRYESITNNLVGNTVIGYKILPNLEVRSCFGYTNNTTKATSMTPVSSLDPVTAATAQNKTIFSGSEFRNWIVEPQINWTPELAKGRFNILVGTSFLNQTTEGLAQTAIGFTSEALMKNIAAATTRTVATNYYAQYRYHAVFGRINYTWNDKYIINLTGRRDGSSRFGPGKQFANFGAAGVAWLFNEESFIKDNLEFLSFGKLRASYGITGNDQLGDYQYLDAYTINGSGYYQTGNGLTPARLSNPDFAWETNKKLEAGLELGVMGNRILSSFSYYHNRSSNQLVGYPLPTTTGFTSIQGNFPATVQNTGVEIELNTRNIDKPGFSWNTSFNLTIPRNKLVEFPNLENFPGYANQYVVGQPLSIVKTYHYTGLDQSTGLYTFQDVDGNASFDFADQQVIKFLGRKFYGGLLNSIQYKGFQLDFLFQFVKQVGYDRLSGIPGSAVINQNALVLDRWQQEGDNTSVSKATTTAGSLSGLYAQSDEAVTDASFVRLNNLSFSYALGTTALEKIHLQTVRLFMQAQNLLTITKYKSGIDPEKMNSDALPALRTITLGIHLTF
jgi:TonB-linked SusC/RagA family outer membrane protein